MVEGLIGFLVLIIVVGIVAYLLNMLLDMVPMDERFKQVARILLLLIAVLIVLMRALPLLGVSI